MAEIITKTYSSMPDLISDISSSYDWYEVKIAENGDSAIFYVSEKIWLEAYMSSSSNLCIAAKRNGTSVTTLVSTSASSLPIQITKTKNSVCISGTPGSTLSPTASTLVHFAVGKTVNQNTGEEETALAYVAQTNSQTYAYIISADNVNTSISTVQVNYLSSNLSSQTTNMQNLFYKNSQCVMKDFYIFTSMQLYNPSFTGFTLNNKKYYMIGHIAVADD